MDAWLKIGRMSIKDGWELVDREFDAEQTYGSTGGQIVRRLACSKAVHPATYGLSLQCSLLACTNGASLQAFPKSATPLSLAVVCVNKAQTRKSQLSGIMTDIGSRIDEVCKERARSQGYAGKVKSLMLENFTESAFWQRCSGDYNQTDLSESQRFHFSCPVALDESYRFLRMIGLQQKYLGSLKVLRLGFVRRIYNKVGRYRI